MASLARGRKQGKRYTDYLKGVRDPTVYFINEYAYLGFLGFVYFLFVYYKC